MKAALNARTPPAHDRGRSNDFAFHKIGRICIAQSRVPYQPKPHKKAGNHGHDDRAQQ
jgi:hypothetical protein